MLSKFGFGKGGIVPQSEPIDHDKAHWDKTKCIKSKSFMYAGLPHDVVKDITETFQGTRGEFFDGLYLEQVEDHYSGQCYDLVFVKNGAASRIGYFEIAEMENCETLVHFWSTATVTAALFWQMLTVKWPAVTRTGIY